LSVGETTIEPVTVEDGHDQDDRHGRERGGERNCVVRVAPERVDLEATLRADLLAVLVEVDVAVLDETPRRERRPIGV
jgi:hypothetical protein